MQGDLKLKCVKVEPRVEPSLRDQLSSRMRVRLCNRIDKPRTHKTLQSQVWNRSKNHRMTARPSRTRLPSGASLVVNKGVKKRDQRAR